MPRERYNINGLDLMVSTRCNLHCRDCYGHLSHNPNADMNLETAILATDFAFNNIPRPMEHNHLSIVLFGGEPLLNWDFVRQYVRWVRKERSSPPYNCSLDLFTNGVLLDKEKLDFLIENDVHLFLSLDGTFEEQNIRRPMGGEQYGNILSAVRHLVDSGRADAFLTAYAVVRKDRWGRITDLLEHFSSLGITRVQLSHDSMDSPADEDRAVLFDAVKKYQAAHPAMRFTFNPESAMHCETCAPKAVAVYPNGDIFDLCFLCAFVLYVKRIISREDLFSLYVGKAGAASHVVLDVDQKRRFIRDNMFCPTLHRSEHFFRNHSSFELPSYTGPGA